MSEQTLFSQERVVRLMGHHTPEIPPLILGVRFAILSFLSAPRSERGLNMLYRWFMNYMQREKQCDFGDIYLGRRILTGYYERNLDGWDASSSVMCSLPIRLSSVTVHSLCDRILEIGDEVCLMRYTTSSLLPEKDALEDIFLSVQSVGFQTTYGRAPNKLALYLLDTGEIQMWNVDPADVSTTRLMIEDAVENYLSLLNEPPLFIRTQHPIVANGQFVM